MGNSTEATETEPKKFDWRTWAHGVEQLPPDVVEKLDQLEALINEGGPEVQDFLNGLEKGGFRRGTYVIAMIHYFRDILTSEERRRLDAEVRKADPSLKL